MSDRPTPIIDADVESWVEASAESDFPIQNLPYGIFSTPGASPRVGAAIGDRVLDLAALGETRLLDAACPVPMVFRAQTLNAFMALGSPVWSGVRERLADLLTESSNRDRVAPLLIPATDATLHLPFSVSDFVDFYASRHHAENMGRILRPDEEPLRENWVHLPVGYHSRAGAVVVSGTPVARPSGQIRDPDANIVFAPTRRLDFEAELGFVIGAGSDGMLVDDPEAHVFGAVLVNDWSARDIQAWEYQPLGPLLGKSFATSISPWVVTLDALAPARRSGPAQVPRPLPHLAFDAPWAFDVNIEVALNGEVVARTNTQDLYWTIAQEVAHLTSNGAGLRTGDLLASGTVSGTTAGSRACLMERTWGGAEPLELADGSKRTFLADGDSIVMRGWARAAGHRIGFGSVGGVVQESRR